jgi:hypothetical protein
MTAFCHTISRMYGATIVTRNCSILLWQNQPKLRANSELLHMVSVTALSEAAKKPVGCGWCKVGR